MSLGLGVWGAKARGVTRGEGGFAIASEAASAGCGLAKAWSGADPSPRRCIWRTACVRAGAMAACLALAIWRLGGRVKAPKFDYVRPGGIAQALELLAAHGEDAQILAGGQSLMPTLNMRLSQPKLLIDINRLDALKGIGLANGHVRIGALARHVEVANSPIIAQHLPLIAAAMPHIAHFAVRNRGTFGGSIALADPAAELPACALALDARFVLQSRDGRREIAAVDFFHGLHATARRPNELLVEALIPSARNGLTVFLELARRHGDFAIAGLAFQLQIEAGVVADGRLAYFASEDRPRLGHGVLAAIKGEPLHPALSDAAVAALPGDLDPICNAQGSAKLRLHLQRVLTRRALGQLCARSRGPMRSA
jgi:aerobic carbon-monoxide dehydrogenase medium subunit